METNLTSGIRREKWTRKTDFLMSVIGFVVDLANVMRFPTLVYKNGGGAFFIPYLVMLFLGGVPLFLMELALGQYHRRGPIAIWGKIVPFCKGIGYCVILISLYVALYYNVMIAWGVYYLFACFSSTLPWTQCDNAWNSPACFARNDKSNIQIGRSVNSSAKRPTPAEEYFSRQVYELHKSTGIDDLGSIKWELVVCLVVVYTISYFSLWKGITVSGKIVWITALFPYFVLLILLLRGMTLPGAMSGIQYYLTPDFSVLKTPSVWVSAGAQVYFSLGPGFGVLLAYASYNDFKNNIYRDAMVCAAVNSATSFVAGFVVFSVLGYMANRANVAMTDVAEEGPTLAFAVYPEALSAMPNSRFWSVMFFLMIISLGLDSSFGGTESVVTGLSDEFEIVRQNRKIFLLILHIFFFVVGLASCTQGGVYVVTFLDAFSAGHSILVACFFETVCVSYIYGEKDFKEDIKDMLGHKISGWWGLCWSIFAPVYIGFLLISGIVAYEPLTFGHYEYPVWANGLGICIALSSVVLIPIYAISRIGTVQGDWTEKLKVVKRHERLLLAQQAAKEQKEQASAKLKSPESDTAEATAQKQKSTTQSDSQSPSTSPQYPTASVSTSITTQKPAGRGTSRSGAASPLRSGTETPLRSGTASPARSGTATPVRSGTASPVRSGASSPIPGQQSAPWPNMSKTASQKIPGPVRSGAATPVPGSQVPMPAPILKAGKSSFKTSGAQVGSATPAQTASEAPTPMQTESQSLASPSRKKGQASDKNKGLELPLDQVSLKGKESPATNKQLPSKQKGVSASYETK